MAEAARPEPPLPIQNLELVSEQRLAMVAVPLECESQDVAVVEEDIDTEVKGVKYRDLQGGVRQMLVSIPLLRKDQTAKALVTFEVRSRPILAPEQTDDLIKPKRPDREIKKFLGKSPYIETGNHRIRRTIDEIEEELPEDVTPWKEIEAIYDYVQAKIKYEEGDDKSAVNTLQDGVGDCYSMSALFVALCRTNKIPARMVWVNDHCYPEFYLEDAEGAGHWFPCQVAGAKAFGEMPETRTILQKGDNFRIPERPKDKLRYASDWAKGVPTPGGGKPKIRFIREAL